MKKLIAAASLLALTACTMPPSHLGGALIMNAKDSQVVTEAKSSKTGRVCGTNILGVYASGDISVEAAKKAGKITKVATVDREIKNYVVFAEVCTIVTGE